MPKLNNLDKTLKTVNKVANNASSITAVVGLVATAATFIAETLNKQEKQLDISACSSTEHPMTIEEVKEYLEKIEVKAVYISMKVSEAAPKYRDCFEFQVVDTTPSRKITRGDIIQVHYITREVIDKSRQLFEELDQQRKTTELEKHKKQSERKEKTKQVITDRIDTVKHGVKKIPTVFRKNIEKRNHDEQEP